MGIDPDLHTMPVVLVDETGKLVHVQIVEVHKKHTGREALVEMVTALQIADLPDDMVFQLFAITVEGQDLYQFGEGKTKNPKSIMFLATAAGAALMAFGGSAIQKYFPTPQEWKGNVPKQIHQARILSRMGIPYDKIGTQEAGYCVPQVPSISQFAQVTKGQWKHVVDAIGLAQYGREKFLEEEARAKRLSESERQTNTWLADNR